MQARGGQMSPKSLKQWILEIGRALDFVARQGMAHRDVKPANILFDDDNNAFLSDFGLAKVVYGDHRDTDAEMTGAGYIVGTPNYVAPEIVLGNSFDGRADQYALALTVFHLMAGASPMQGASSTATIVNQTQRILPLLNTVRPDVPIGVALAVQQALQKRPAMRFPSSADFAEAVIAGLSAGSESSSSVHQAAQSRVTRNRHPDHRKSDQSRRSSSSTVSSRQSQTDRVSVGKRGLVKCPHCQVPLPLRPIHSGRRGRCIHCHAALKISKDLNKLWLLSSNSEGSGKNSGRSNKSQELIIGEEVFGWKLSKKSAAFMAAGLLIMTLIATVYLTVFVTKESEADRLEQKVNALRATED
jgi:serine/threonine protein kinase